MSIYARKILKITEWQGASGKWYAADTIEFTKWWVIPRMLEMSLDEYAKMLVEKYHATGLHFVDYGNEDKRNSLLLFNFESYTTAHQFVLDMNKFARNKKFLI